MKEIELVKFKETKKIYPQRKIQSQMALLENSIKYFQDH